MDKNQGYAILKAVMLENGRGFALGEHPTAPSRYVTWACYDDKDGLRQYEWGHYGNDRTAMEQDFTDRVQDYQRIYNVGIRQTEAPGLYKYYSTQRPVDIGTFPKPPYNKPDEIFNYDQRVPVENGSFLAYRQILFTFLFHIRTSLSIATVRLPALGSRSLRAAICLRQLCRVFHLLGNRTGPVGIIRRRTQLIVGCLFFR